MSKKNKNVPVPEQENVTVKQSKKKKKKGGLFGRIVRRFFLLLFTVVLLLVADLCLVMNLVFNGPSQAACEVLTMRTIWCLWRESFRQTGGSYLPDFIETVEIFAGLEKCLPLEVKDFKLWH